MQHFETEGSSETQCLTVAPFLKFIIRCNKTVSYCVPDKAAQLPDYVFTMFHHISMAQDLFIDLFIHVEQKIKNKDK